MESPQTFSEILGAGFREEVVILSRDFKIIGANEKFLQGNNLTLQDVEGRSCHDILRSCLNSCKTQAGECPLSESLATQMAVSVTHQDVMVESSLHHYKIDVYPVPGGPDTSEYFLHITRDVTDRIEEERLKDKMWMKILNQMETLYAAMVEGNENIEHIRGSIDQLIEIVPLAVVGWDKKGRIASWNANAEILFGQTADEVLGKPFIEFFASGPSQKKFAEIMQVLQMGQTEFYSLGENRTASGHIITCEWHHNVYQLDDKGNMAACLSMGLDATERLALEKKSQRLESQLAAVLNATGEAIVGLNSLRRITFWNPAAEKLFGWLAKEVQGREVEMLIPADIRESVGKNFRNFLEKAQPRKEGKVSFEASALRRDGITVPVEITLSFALIEEKAVGFAVFHEITEKKRTEKILVQAEKMRSLGEMTNGVVHDFNNSLTTILGNIKLIKEMGVDSEMAEKFDAIEKAALHGTETISDLQGFGISADETALSRQNELLEIKPILEEVRNLTRFRWKDLPQKEGFTIDFTLEVENNPVLCIQRAGFREMLTNLVFNAVEAMPGGGRIHLTADKVENRLQLTIRDNGTGLTKKETASIFEPYFTTKGKGHAGLGLYIVKRFVEGSEGTITVESTKGAGTIFKITLPLDAIAAEDKAQEEKTFLPAKFRILVIDDDPLVSDLLKQVLENDGHDVMKADNGREGVRTFRKNNFDLVITNHGMPDMNGLDTAFRIKKQKPDVPVFLITGWQVEMDAAFQKPSAVDQIIAKPFDPDKIIGLVQKYGLKISNQ
jgi:PAS domain S-box-containing protein